MVGVTVLDVLAKAVEIERRGVAFYTELSEQSKWQADKNFFAFLAEEEKNHERIFTEMLDRLKAQPFDADPALLEYLQELSTSHGIFSKDKMDIAKKSPIASAISFEKDTLLFFTEVRRLVPEPEQHILRSCIEEERKHLQILIEYTADEEA